MLIRSATVIDPETRTAERRDLTVGEGLIGSASGEPDETIDASGLFVLPGLIDAHVHLVPFPMPPAQGGGAVVAEVVNGLREAVKAGVTTVRDLGGDLSALLAARDIANHDDFGGSQVLVAGPMLSVPNGHGTGSSHGVALSSAGEGAAMARALCRAPVDQVKIVTSGANGQHQMAPDIMEAVANEAHSANMPVAVHAHLQVDQIATAVRLGVRTIEHGFLLHKIPETVEEMSARGVFLCPTLRVVEAIREHPTNYGQRLVPAAWNDALASVRAASLAGVPIVAGTDGGVFGVGYQDLWREMTLIAEQCGSRWDGIRAATCVAAEALGRGELGTLREGSRADLVFLRRDPLAERAGAMDVAAVMRNGRLVHGAFR